MNRRLVLLAIGFAIHTLLAGPSTAEEFPILRGDYLGQKPPGLTPQKFAPGIISTDGNYEGGATFSADGNVFIYKRFHPDREDPEEIWLSERRDGIWTKPVRAPFDGEHSDWDFAFEPTGTTFYFTSKRPAVIDGKKIRYSGIWSTDWSPSGWSEPRRLGPPVNVLETYSGYPSLTRDGTIYFHSEREDSRGDVDIYRARWTDGAYRKVENLGASVSTEHREFDPCIAPDESYLVFVSNRPSTYEHPYQMYVAFRNSDGSWREPNGLGPLLGEGGLPQISADGKYFFFVGGRSAGTSNADIYWVDTKIFDQFRPKGTD